MNVNLADRFSLTEHLDELRKRLIICIISILIGFIISYFFKEKIFSLLMKPLILVMNEGDNLIYTGLPEAFFTFLKISFFSGFVISFPIIVYQFWVFVAPGLYDKEKKFLIYIVFLSTIFFIAGISFGYFIVFPFGFKFFLSFATDFIKPLPSLKEYLKLSLKLLFAFGMVFELPLVLTLLAKLGIVSSTFLRKNRKFAILLFFAGAAILTPPDIITQIMMALPLILLYEISILSADFFGKKD